MWCRCRLRCLRGGDWRCLAAVSGICSALTQELSVSPSFPALGCNNLALCNVSGDTPAYMFFVQRQEFKLAIVSHLDAHAETKAYNCRRVLLLMVWLW